METTDWGSVQAILTALALIFVALTLLVYFVYWRLFQKAGQPGWTGIVPIYNMIVLMRIIGRPGWHLLLLLIPFYGWFVLPIIMTIELCKVFGRRSTADYLLAIFLGIFYFPYLAFSSSVEYVGPANKEL